ncbi:uncharacterized protein MYCFIDRAFT_78573 [Pseudocercospora fijiensis CIRAD86]|uniref:Uncharacterized protein n=1 Tax=Pseudocercospora fijiensis (strain CIRAD86) TaxID=383855 RepID=N1QCR4_PSEFD|nr:uncharacterized protein MYCFIDRAFT_78573 [Pseudocercospora fijiensis CIRAD86]EME89632.1 hypothetical protein MYCFIDRAFT_78573 [Pseudocercospora fijiensis CIRAD86]
MAKKKTQIKPAGRKVVAQLELPDPVPPTKSKRAQKREEAMSQKAPTSVPAPSVAPSEQDVAPAVAQGLPPSLPHLSASKKLTSPKHPFGVALEKEKERQRMLEEDEIDSEAGPVKLMAQFGTILMRYDEQDWKKLTYRVHDPSDLQASFRKNADFLKSDFLNRLTTSTTDATSLIHLARGQETPELETDTRYDIFVRDTAGVLLKLTVDASRKSAYSIKKLDRIVGEALSHFPVHVWDARFLIVELGLESETTSLAHIKNFIMSIETDQKAPSFRAHVPLGIRIEVVLAKRSFAFHIDEMRFSATQVQSLCLESMDRKHNFRALARTEEDMIAEQRLWWEVGWETFDLEKADYLQAKVNEMVPQMDAVGLENKGPFVRLEGYEEAQGLEVPEIPFW